MRRIVNIISSMTIASMVMMVLAFPWFFLVAGGVYLMIIEDEED